MIITKATYGGVDCTSQITSRITGGTLCVKADNNIIGDPQIGTKKQLIIQIDDKTYFTEEGDLFIYPRSKHNRLGIWYTNNKSNKNINALKKSLNTIEICSSDKADIITCVWNRIDGNKFLEIESWYKETSHLNQLLQILQCLCLAKKIKQYDYVSFLEHDVMYPEGYFDFPDFSEGKILVNMNYGGINKYGWQDLIQKDQPMHQMTMRFEDAINHLKHILENALVCNAGNIENNSLIREVWRCKNQSIHINHGNHFTSHYTIYDQSKNLSKYHDYWGDHKNYIYLLE